MKISRLTCCVVMIVAGSVAADLMADEPKPSPTPVSWELTFKPSTLTRIQVDTGAGPKTYWYVVYTVINNTGQEVDFHPEVVRVSEVESELPAEQAAAKPEQAPRLIVDDALVGVHPKVYEAVKQLHAKTQPFLVPPVQAISRLRQGADNALTSVMIFADLDPRVSKFTIYFTGLSGETATVPNPKYDSKGAAPSGKPPASPAGQDDNPKFFVLRKTLAMPYTLPGDANTRKSAVAVLGRMEWVMR